MIYYCTHLKKIDTLHVFYLAEAPRTQYYVYVAHGLFIPICSVLRLVFRQYSCTWYDQVATIKV